MWKNINEFFGFFFIFWSNIESMVDLKIDYTLVIRNKKNIRFVVYLLYVLPTENEGKHYFAISLEVPVNLFF